MLTEGMRARVGNEPGPTWYARTGAVEDWAESVAGYLFPEYFQALEAEVGVGNPLYQREHYQWQAMPDRPPVEIGPGLLPLHLACVEEQFRALCGR
jgi:hypothetical protein